MASIQVYNNTENYSIKRININYFGYGEREFLDKLKSRYKFHEFLTKEDLVNVLSELDGRIGKKTCGLLLYYAFLNKGDFRFKLER
jgi:hypothetical protein